MSRTQQINTARPARLLVLLLVTVTQTVGCHRQFYRRQADMEANALIDEKASHVARPPNTQIRIDIDRRSRMFNPFDLDFQPMPLDDPNSYRYMQCVGGRRGYPMWEAAGITNTAENPDWWRFLPLDDDGVLVLNSENAFRLALLHSPQYQSELEELYLAALDVTAQRFEFETQFFGGYESIWRTSGRRSPTGTSTTLEVGPQSNGQRDLSLQRRFATGGNLIVGVANSIVWELAGTNSQSAATVLDFSLLQPLLRAAGRDVVMEDLTQAERTLLARVRGFERFRRTFFLNITVGESVQVSANTNVGQISISDTGQLTNPGGFLGLLQNQLQIRNSKENIVRLAETVQLQQDTLIELLTTIPDDAGQIVSQRLQVAQARQSLFNAEQNLVNQQAGFQRSIEIFLRTLGLPPYLCVKLDDPFLDRFELIDRDLLIRREELSRLRSSIGEMNVSILERGEFKLDPDTGLPVSQIEWSPELAQTLAELRKELEPLAEFVKDLIGIDLPVISNDIEQLTQALSERQREAADLKSLYDVEKDSICGLLNLSELPDSIFDVGELMTLSNDLRTEFDELRGRLTLYQERIQKLEQSFDKLQADAETADPRQLAATLRDDIILASQDIVAELGDDVLALQLIQARGRTESVTLPEVDIAPEVALEIARNNRRDWANARAALVDSWREIEVVADNLESSLDLVLTGDVRNGTNNPFKLRSSTGSLRAQLRWDAPITRLLERNAYRRQLITYERNKRTFYQFEDAIWLQLRNQIRQLQANRFTFELARELIRNSAEQIGLNADQRALNEARGRAQGPTAARDQIQALAALLNAQNGLLGIYVNYEVVRRSLDLDMGTMELSPDGLWIDPGKITADRLVDLPGTTAYGMIECGCNDCGLKYNPLPPEPKYGGLRPTIQEVSEPSSTTFEVEVPLTDPVTETPAVGSLDEDGAAVAGARTRQIQEIIAQLPPQPPAAQPKRRTGSTAPAQNSTPTLFSGGLIE